MDKTWRRWRTSVTVLALCALAAAAAAQTNGWARVKVDTANLRQGPGTNFEVLARAYENDPLKVLGRKGKWLSVLDFQGSKSWIYGSLIDREPAVIVTASTANVRSGPGTRHAIVFTAERGVAFRVLASTGRWLKVEHEDGDQGWIYERLVWGADADS